MSAASVLLPPLAITNPVETAVDTPAVDYEPFLPDEKFHKSFPPELLTLTEKQEADYQEVLKHFASGEFAIPGIEAGDGKLTEEEKFYLVSSIALFYYLFTVLRA
jgi:hypothetical protein